jgi:hypothetical protein
MTYNDALNYLIDGNITSAVHETYNYPLGFWWEIIVFVSILLVTYISTKNEGITAFVGLVGAGIVIKYGHLSLVGQPIVYLIIALSVAMLLYKAFGKKQ